MPAKLSYAEAKQIVDAVTQAVKEGFKYPGTPSAVREAADKIGVSHSTAYSRLEAAATHYQLYPERSDSTTAYDVTKDNRPEIDVDVEKVVKQKLLLAPRTLAELVVMTKSTTAHVLDALDSLSKKGVRIHRMGDRFDIPKQLEAAYLSASRLELTSDANNKFKIGVVSDNHCGSRYERRDVLADLYDRFAAAGVKHVLHAGNWIDGECRFNRFDLEAHGVEMQCQLLAETYPRRDGITTYAIAGDDHEGWFAQKEGVDVGAYCEGVMKRFGREDWVHLGNMEAHIPLVNANTGKRAIAALVHPGGGSAYALSYAIQKIIESLEGGEKPAVGFYGHYHKLMAANIRNVWCLQTGCCQDQTPFMRKNKIEAHVGGTIVEMEQDPESGAIIGFMPYMIRYFARGFYEHRWSHGSPVNQAERSVGGV